MEKPEDILFKTTSDISVAQLGEKYGKLLQGDIVLKLAEHKNFDAAKAAFDAWDYMEVFDMQYYLTHAFPHEEWVQEPLDSYIAHAFVMKLIGESNNLQQEVAG